MDVVTVLFFICCAAILGYILGGNHFQSRFVCKQTWRKIRELVGFRPASYSNQPVVKSLPGSGHIFQNLTKLLEDQPDTAIDTFLSSVEITPETLDVHYALGTLLRKRGEHGRAILVHQNVLNSLHLDKHEKHHAQLNVAIDYLSAGVFDRAEALLKEISDASGVTREILHQSLGYLVNLYESTKEWALAIDIADRLTDAKFSPTADKWRIRQSYYCCELAEQYIVVKEYRLAKQWVQSAIRYDQSTTRAYLIHAKIEMALNDYSSALEVIRITAISQPFLSEILVLAKACHNKVKTLDAFYGYAHALYKESPNLVLLNYFVHIEQEHNKPEYPSVIDELMKYSSLEHINDAIEAVREATQQAPVEKTETLIAIIDKNLQKRLRHKCHSCGFTGHEMHWLCPSCRSWGSTFVPVLCPSEP